MDRYAGAARADRGREIGGSEQSTKAMIQEPQEFFQRNLAAIKTWAPHLYVRLAGMKSLNTELIVDPDGGLDIGFRGRRLYNRDAVALAENQVEQFARAPVREHIREPNPKSMKGATGSFCEALVRRMADADIAYDRNTSVATSHFVLLFGIGLGVHLEPIIRQTQAKVAVLIEPHIEFLYHSLHVTDWVKLFETGEERGVRFCLIVSQAASDIASKTLQLMRGNNPTLLDGVSFFKNFQSPILEQAEYLIRKDLFLAVSGLGYIDDEIIMCRNGFANLAAGTAEILSDYHSDRDETLFVVGSGPSVEGELDFIGRHADRALIMSIGTGLRALLDRGIQPDFHIELENGPGSVDIIAATAKDFDFADVTLVASVTVNPGLAKYFKRAIFFFREGVTSTQLFGGPFVVLRPAGPTVANAAAVSAIRLGFREIYLFGVDMGSKVEGKFHAEGSVYGAGLRAEVVTVSAPFPGNFGGTASGSGIFDWSRKVLENTLHHYDSVRVYNCSDGVRIDGAVPKVSRAIELTGEALDRAAVQKHIEQATARCTPDLLSRQWAEADLRAHVETILREMDRILANLAAGPSSRVDWLDRFCDLCTATYTETPPVGAFLNGTLQVAIGCASWYDRRLTDPQARAAYRAMAAEELQALLRIFRDALEPVFDEIEASLKAHRAETAPAVA